MARNYYHNEGYSRGGLDVVTGVNLFFKGLLLFPVFVLAAFVGLAMMKHVIFNGIPTMNAPTEEQREAIQQRDEQISLAPESVSQPSEERSGWEFPPLPVLPEKNQPQVSNTVSNCPEGHPMRNVIGANGLPWVCSTTSHRYYEVDENYQAL